MAKRLWCILLTAVMLLNLLPVGMADNEGLEEPFPAAELQQQVQEVTEEPLPPEETLPEEEAAEEPIPYEAEPQSEEEEAEEALPNEEETEPVEERPGEMLDLLTDGVIPDAELLNEELPEDELSEELEAAEMLPEDEDHEDDGEEEEMIPLTQDELATLGIYTNETVYPITPGRKCISTGTWTIKENVDNWREAWIDGKVTIILPDDLRLAFLYGLEVTSGNELTITVPQGSKGNGKLYCNGGGGYQWAGIGGRKPNSKYASAGKITIKGGDIEARGGPGAAGIGGSSGGMGGDVTIEGGRMFATGGWGAASIGGGSGASCGPILITGGTVSTLSGGGGAGIGGGDGGYASLFPDQYITINGGTVKAYSESGGGAGLGAGRGKPGGNVIINGGTVTAEANDGGAGIGGGAGGENIDFPSLKPITINGGTVKAYGYGGGAGIGAGANGHYSTVIINNGDVEALSGGGGAGIGAGDSGKPDGNVIINDGRVVAHGGQNAAGIGGGSFPGRGGIIYGGNITINGGIVKAYGGEHGSGIGGGDHSGAIVTINGGTVEATGGKMAAGIGEGWLATYESGGTITIRDGNVTAIGGENGAGIGTASQGSNCQIDIYGGTVTVTGGKNGSGIGGGGRKASYGINTIYGGTIIAQGGENASGIGGDLKIKGGNITATGGANGAGIGGSSGDTGEVNISGGTITATGGTNGAGIGGGFRAGGWVLITDGIVTATGGAGNDPGAGIGGGGGAYGGRITISGGTVTAKGGKGWNTDGLKHGGAGIGGGGDATGGNILIEGGTVIAVGGEDGAGIGAGSTGAHGGNITITGGNVTATGNRSSAGIGGSFDYDSGIITISGGFVTAFGGEEHGRPEVGGAGIGSGGFDRGGAANITITGGIVMATGGSRAPGIGRAWNPYRAGTVKLSPELNAINLSDDSMQTQIIDPTLLKLERAKKVLVGKFVPEPKAAGNLPYNGREQSGYLNPGQPLLIDGIPAATEPGNYEFTVAPGAGYTWTDGTNAEKTLSWAIDRAKVIVTANDRTITYGDREPELTATVRGTLGRDRINYQISREPGKDAGIYNITPSGEEIQGNYDVYYVLGTLTIRPKNVSAIRESVFQTIPAGTGDFTAPTFRDRTLDEDITGTLTYAYNRRRMTEEELRKALADLPAGARGTITWSYAANGNFAGTITGRIDFVITGIEFTVDGAPATAANAVTIKNNPTYGDTWEEIVTISDRIAASVNGETGSGQYTLNVSGTPNAGRQTYSVLFTGIVNRITYTDVTVLTGEVDIAKADYPNVTKTASGEIEPEAGRTITITLPEIPQGTSYGTPRKAVESDPYRLFGISGNQLPVSLTDIPKTNPMTFTVPVNPDGNHNSYDITVTLTVISDAHTHFFRYTVNGNQITAVCRAANCPLPPEGVRLTLNAPANLMYDGSAKEVTFASGEAEAWKAATGNNAPVITYTADRGSALTGGKPVNAGSYTASIRVYGQRVSLRFTVSKVNYTGVTKEISAELNAARNSRTTITLPAIPNGTSYGRPVETPGSASAYYTLSDVSDNRVTLRSAGFPRNVKTVSFTVPVIADSNHNGYTITVTVDVIQPRITVAVKVKRESIQILPRIYVPGYVTAITADSTVGGSKDLRVEYSTTGLLYLPGNQIVSLLPISHFYIRVTDSRGVRYNYEYINKRVFPR